MEPIWSLNYEKPCGSRFLIYSFRKMISGQVVGYVNGESLPSSSFGRLADSFRLKP